MAMVPFTTVTGMRIQPKEEIRTCENMLRSEPTFVAKKQEPIQWYLKGDRAQCTVGGVQSICKLTFSRLFSLSVQDEINYRKFSLRRGGTGCARRRSRRSR